MQNLKPNLTQQIINLCNSQEDFTYNLSKKPLDYYNYIVSIESIKVTKNPSLEFGLNGLISGVINYKTYHNNKPYFDSIGMWFNNGFYYIDANLHFYDLGVAKEAAKLHNQVAIWDIKNNKEITIKY
jgi:hypothetical protein